jgi:ferredoxin
MTTMMNFSRRALASQLRTTPLASLFPTINSTKMQTSRSSAKLSTVAITFVQEGTPIRVKAVVGDSLLACAHKHSVEMEGACGGELACSTCHVILNEGDFKMVSKLCPKSEEEEDLLDLAWGLTDTSRLGCQIVLRKEFEGLTVHLPEETSNMQGGK